MKRFLILLLTLLFALSVLPASAQEDELFLPGRITARLVRESLRHGRHVSADFSGIFVPGEGITDDPEEMKLLEALSELLSNSALRLGYARTDEGLRIEIGGYCIGGENIVFSDNAVTLNRDGVIVDSDLMDGRRITVLWETVLRYLGLDEETTGEILSLRDRDFSALLESLVEEHLPVLLQMAGDTLSPYAAILSDWAGTLSVQTVSSAAGHDDLPAFAEGHLLQITIYEADWLNLCGRLVEQLEQDEVLLPLLDTAVSSGTLLLAADGQPAGSLTELLPEIKESLAAAREEATEDHSTVLTVGTSDEGLPFALCLDDKAGETGEPAGFTLLASPVGGDGKLPVTLRLYGGQAEKRFVLAADALIFADPQEPTHTSFELTCDASVGGESLVSAEAKQSLAPITAESGQPGYRGEQSAVMNIRVPAEADSLSVRSVAESTCDWVRTEDGGESFTVHGISDLYADEDSFSSITDASFTIEPTEGGLFDATFYETVSLPSTKVDSAGFIALVSADDYIPLTDGFQTLAWEDMSSEESDELQADILSSARIKRDQLLDAMPPVLRETASQYIGGNGGEEPGLPSQEGYLDGFSEGYATGYDDGFRAGFEAASGRPFSAPETEPAPAEPAGN